MPFFFLFLFLFLFIFCIFCLFFSYYYYCIIILFFSSSSLLSLAGPPEDEIQWILNEVEKYLDDSVRVRRADVLSAWQGFRPLASDPHAPPDAPISRDHIISINQESGITFITGGKQKKCCLLVFFFFLLLSCHFFPMLIKVLSLITLKKKL